MSTAHFRRHFQRKLLPILRIDREFSERRRNGFLFPRPWGRWWGRIGGEKRSHALFLAALAVKRHSYKNLDNKGKVPELQRSSGTTCGAQGAHVELVQTRDHLLLVAMAA